MTEEMIEKTLDEIDANISHSSQFTDVELSYLEIFATHKEDYTRSRVAAVLADFTEQRGENLLLRLAKDKDSLVRTEACDSLQYSQSASTYEFLRKRAKRDKNSMVRGYAVSSFTEISKGLHVNTKTKEFLLELQATEKDVFTKINIYKALYDMGETQYLKHLLKNLNAKVYQNRCAAVNPLKEIVTTENSERIKAALNDRKRHEKSRAVSSSIYDLLKMIEDLYNN